MVGILFSVTVYLMFVANYHKNFTRTTAGFLSLIVLYMFRSLQSCIIYCLSCRFVGWTNTPTTSHRAYVQIVDKTHLH